MQQADQQLYALALSRANKSKGGAKPPGMLHLNYPLSYVMPIFMRWVLSNYVALPDEGGYGDQDAALMDDLNSLLSRYNVQVARVAKLK